MSAVFRDRGSAGRADETLGILFVVIITITYACQYNSVLSKNIKMTERTYTPLTLSLCIAIDLAAPSS